MWKENKAKIRHILAWGVLWAFTALAGYIGVGKMIIGAVFTLLAALDAHAVTWVLGGTVFISVRLRIACNVWYVAHRLCTVLIHLWTR